jgi:hypothetical protein
MRDPCFSTICVLVLSVFPSTAQLPKPNLSGIWKLDVAKSEIHSPDNAEETMEIEQKESKIHVTIASKRSDGKETRLEFHCNMDGKDCDAGESKISLWFNGSSLVLMDVGADVVTKSSMKLGPDGKTMSVDVTHISPHADPDKLLFEKS